MSEVKEHIRNLVADNVSNALENLLSIVQFQDEHLTPIEKQRLVDALIMSKGQFVSASQDYNSGLITRPERELVFQRVSKSLLSMLEAMPSACFELSEEDEKLFYEGKLKKNKNQTSATALPTAVKHERPNLRWAWLAGLSALLIVAVWAIAKLKPNGSTPKPEAAQTQATEPEPEDAKGFVIAGEVVCMDSDEPLKGVTVQIDTFKPLVTNEDGKYSGLFPLNIGDRYLLTLTKGSQLLFKEKVMVTENQSVIPIQSKNCNY